MELLLGCGKSRAKKIFTPGREAWNDLCTVDMTRENNPDIVHDIAIIPLPFSDNSADEIHAYEVLEHVGRQGDWIFFFRQFSDFWRILKPGGMFFGSSPHPTSNWAWGDPGHTRVMSIEAFSFLAQPHYDQIEKGSPCTDYRPYYTADFDIVSYSHHPSGTMTFALKAIKPSRSKFLKPEGA